MTACLTHIALHVRDLDRCVEFYREYCGLEIVRERRDGDGKRIVWLAEPGRATEFIFVLLPGGPGRRQAERDFSHFGFALASRQAVDAIAEKGRAAGCLEWAPRQEPFPVGYYCGLKDPDGNFVEFSFGQPLGPAPIRWSLRHDVRLADEADIHRQTRAGANRYKPQDGWEGGR